MAQMTFYPDAHPETSSVDGFCAHTRTNSSWSVIRGGGGTVSQDSTIYLWGGNITCGQNIGTWQSMNRSIILFDTSALPDDAIIVSAILSIYGTEKEDNAGWNPQTNVYASNPGSNKALASGDFDSLGTTALCDTPIAFADWDITGYNDFTLNAAGLTAISKTGITKLGLRNANYDVANVAPTWVLGGDCDIGGSSTDAGEAYRPKLWVNYVTPGYSLSYGYIFG